MTARLPIVKIMLFDLQISVSTTIIQRNYFACHPTMISNIGSVVFY